MNDKLICLQHFAPESSGANTVVNFSGNNETHPTLGQHGYAGAMNATSYTAGSGTSDLSAEMKTFYDKTLIRLAGPKLVHDQFAQKRPIPRNSGKTIEFRRFRKLPKATKPLTEGVTPKGQKLGVTAVKATVEQYGSYVEQTDQLELTAIDNTIVEATRELSDQAGRTMDTITRDELHTSMNRRFSRKDNGNGTYSATGARSALTKDCPLTVKDVFFAATDLKRNDAPKINGDIVAIIHPIMGNALMTEAGDAWMDVHRYGDQDAIYKGEIGKLAGVRFVESTEAKIYAPAVISDGKNKLTVKETLGSAGTSVKVDEVLTAGTYSGTAKIPVYINGTLNYITAIANNTTYSTLTFENSVSTTDGAIGNMVCGTGGGKDGSAVFGTVFIGSDNAYGVTEVEGGGLEHIVKQRGYGNDPLNQRSSIGWKGMKTAKLLIDEYVLIVESTSPEYSMSAEEN